ncbi:MAG: Hpt domain-containing protein [Calditerrivibrio sp.]|uniref:Hpt domain-containing protein n=1 Tax=Calditerrivibrio sp. TaxID=2792612 RepID=UPI003D0CBF15
MEKSFCFVSDFLNFQKNFPNDNIKKKLIDIFLDELSDKLHELEGSFANRDIKSFKYLIHHIKGMVANMRFSSLLKEIEKINEITNKELFPDKELFESLLQKLKDIIIYLKNFDI